MHRAPLLGLLDEYLDRHADEKRTVDLFRRFIQHNRDCFERHLAVGHLTGSAWILDRSRKRALLTHHRKLGCWVQLGGHADGDSDILRVAAREAREESGLAVEPLAETIFDLDVHEIPARGGVPLHLHYDLRFLMCAVGSEAFSISPESHELAWVPLDRISAYTGERSVLRMRDKTLDQVTHWLAK